MSYASRRGTRFRTEAESWNDAQKKDWILNRLRVVARDAQRHSRYYQRVFSATGFSANDDFGFDDFAQLPVLEREDVINNEEEMVATNIERSRLRLDSTGGSTGKPVRVWLGPNEVGWRHSGIEYFQGRVGATAGKKTALLWGHHLDPVNSNSLKQQALAFLQNYRWFDCFRLSPEVLARYHQEMQRWRPDCIIAYAGALAALAQHVLERGYTPAYPRVCSITGAEKLYPQQRELVSEAFGSAFERYGSREIGLIAFQCDCQRPELTVDWANLLIEPEMSEPESAILVTKLQADGMPMIRYRIGDVARFPIGSQPGHPAFEIEEVLGRFVDRILLRNGNWVNGLQFPHLMKGYPVREFMLTQRMDYSIDLQIVPMAGFGEEDRRDIEHIIASNLPGLLLRINLVQQVERNRASKLRPVVSEVVSTKSAV